MSTVKKILFGGTTSLPFSAELALLCARLFAGFAMALAHGTRKVPPAEGFVEFIGSLGFPVPLLFAWLAGISELVGGILLAVGLLVRPAAILLLITMGVAFYSHLNDPFPKQELPLLFFFTYLIFLSIGGGRLSIDRFLR